MEGLRAGEQPNVNRVNLDVNLPIVQKDQCLCGLLTMLTFKRLFSGVPGGKTFFVASVSFCKIRLADSATTSGEMLTLLTFC